MLHSPTTEASVSQNWSSQKQGRKVSETYAAHDMADIGVKVRQNDRTGQSCSTQAMHNKHTQSEPGCG